MTRLTRHNPVPALVAAPAAAAASLRFAPLIRVSTEQQEKQGESLRTQRNQIIESVARLNGVIPNNCWRYCGQEHATPGHDRKLFDSLLEDAAKGLFDAVIVCDVSRWSRDNVKSKEGLKILQDHGIRFFVGSCEHDLSNPATRLYLGISTEFNEFHAGMQAMRSIENRINRAKRGIPTCGKLPFGRTFDDTKDGLDENGVHRGWGIDPVKGENIRVAAHEYLSGVSLSKIALKMGVNGANLWKVLTRRSGDTWEQTFDYPKAKIHEIVTVKVPRLLPEETIAAIHARAKSNKTYTHGEIKHRYLFARMVFCGACGLAMFGQTNHQIRRYYRHSRHGEPGKCDASLWVPAEELESAVFAHLYSVIGNATEMELAIEAAIPNKEMLNHLRHRQAALKAEIKRNTAAKARLMSQLVKGTITEVEFEPAMVKVREQEQLLAADLCLVDNQLSEMPDKVERHNHALELQKKFKYLYNNATDFKLMTYEEKRSLVELVFGGTTPDGKRCGIYIERTNTPKHPWRYIIRGNLPREIEDLLPLPAKGTLANLGIQSKDALRTTIYASY